MKKFAILEIAQESEYADEMSISSIIFCDTEQEQEKAFQKLVQDAKNSTSYSGGKIHPKFEERTGEFVYWWDYNPNDSWIYRIRKFNDIQLASEILQS